MKYKETLNNLHNAHSMLKTPVECDSYPFKYYKNIPHLFKFLANIPVSLKTIPGPQY